MEKLRKIAFEIRGINNLIKRDIEKTHPSEIDSAKGVHGWAIRYFYENSHKDVFQKDFEEFFSIRRSTATQILKLMEKNGLIVRTCHESDGRMKKITLTERAIEIHKLIVKDIEKREDRMKRGISDDELASFYETIDKIKANLEDNDVK
ncbi:MAG: MarR family transcriptional regulator [Clostridia bacterium]|nr:MarR family transcriptional regulator [Clostridia bacterium]